MGPADQPSFVEAEGLAVDQSTGDLLVIDGEANTVSRYNADGTPADFSGLGSNVINGAGTGDGTPQGKLSFGGPGEVQLAVDNSGGATDGDIYVPQSGPKVVDVFGEDGSYLGQLSASSEGNFSEPCGVAVDPDGNVYVGDFKGDSIHKFEPAANPPVNGDSSANFAFSEVCAVAAGSGPSDGSIFAAHFGESVAKLDSATGEEEYVVSNGHTTTLGVDPGSGEVFTAEEAAIREFDASGPLSAIELSDTPLGSEATGVAIDETSGAIYANHVGGTQVEVFGPLAAGFSLTIKKGPGDGEGAVETVSPHGISCGFSCAEASDLYSEGALVELVAEPAPGSKFVGWTALAGGAGTCVVNFSPCFVFLNSARELQADFKVIRIPAVTEISPAQGPIAAGNLIEITGTGLAEATTVEFGDAVVNTPFAEDTESSIKVKAPKGMTAGPVDVVVTTGDGSSPVTPADQYTYVARPVVTGLSPATGPIAGGNQVEIAGLNLLEATKVEFGGAILTPPFAENTATAITVDAPAHAAGKVDVRVTTIGNPSRNRPPDDYTYADPTKVPSDVNADAGSGPVVSSPPEPPPKVGTPKVAANAVFSGGKAALQITCEGAGACSGLLTLKAVLGAKSKVIGKASYDIATGQSEKIKVKITNSQVKNALKEGKTVRATLSGDGLLGSVKLKPSA